MRVLLVKMSSLGDVVHTFPALSDFERARPEARIDWAVEEGLVELASLHPAVANVMPIALRRWRRAPWAFRSELAAFRHRLRAQHYDVVLDAQGLIKSALVARLARAQVRIGLDATSAREPAASTVYNRRIAVAGNLHAIERLRRLFETAFAYERQSELDYGLGRPLRGAAQRPPRLVLLHGTSWPSKHWPEPFWRRLAELADAAGCEVILPWGSAPERERALRLAAALPRCRVPERASLSEIADTLRGADAAVSVDTGLGHLAAALGVPTVALYGPTDPALTGVLGPGATSLQATFACAPCFGKECAYYGAPFQRRGQKIEPACFSRLPPEDIWDIVGSTLGARRNSSSSRKTG